MIKSAGHEHCTAQAFNPKGIGRGMTPECRIRCPSPTARRFAIYLWWVQRAAHPCKTVAGGLANRTARLGAPQAL